MINAETYIHQLIDILIDKFGTRLVYVGLQGSYLRNEATKDSDIDIMVVIDQLAVSDLDEYRKSIQSLAHFDKSCGFICSKADLKNWNRLEICHLLHTTKDYYGILKTLVPQYSKCDIQNFIKLSINNLYHEICHRYIHSYDRHNIERLTDTYKGVFFILQNLHYLTQNQFIATKAELLEQLDGINRIVLLRSIELTQGIAHDLSESLSLLFSWCQQTLETISEIT